MAEHFYRTFHDTVYVKEINISADPEPAPFSGILNDPAVTLASVSAAARPVRSALRSLVVAAVARRGKVSEDTAEKALSALEADSGRPLIDWLLSGGLEALIKLILELLPLFA